MKTLRLTIDGADVEAEEGSTILEAAKLYGFDIPTLCYHQELTPYGVCGLCTVEVENMTGTRLTPSCTRLVEEGMKVKTHTGRVVNGRKMMVELLLAMCPSSKTLQDLASKMGVEKIRFKMEDKDCVLCGLCSRMCEEQMKSGYIGLQGRAESREVAPFHVSKEVCRNCGACMYICPVVDLQCRGVKTPGELCNSCLVFTPQCLEEYGQVMCTLESCGACVEKKEAKK